MNTPLADRLRPESLDDIVGQKELLAPGRPLRKIIESGNIPNLIFYGPSGVGKTTLASYIARITNRSFKKLNGTTASTAAIKEIVPPAQMEEAVFTDDKQTREGNVSVFKDKLREAFKDVTPVEE